jgi:hypothetical protein
MNVDEIEQLINMIDRSAIVTVNGNIITVKFSGENKKRSIKSLLVAAAQNTSITEYEDEFMITVG